ncbi:SCO2400 family protein [Streptomyces sp. NBC_01353]|uniref:SCO2400 family protein n=1 Tax=Streptomyces sp. NBC_01353 TaxID=2903835 RepID=UPI002E36AF12|nr:hypothetical protein [Streptomyces sp. NBC_01353]
MDYCSSCRRHLNGALVCPGCGAYAPDIAPITDHGRFVPASPTTAVGADHGQDTWQDPSEDPVGELPAPEGRAARRRQRARWRKSRRRAVVATAFALVGGGLTVSAMDRQGGERAQAATAPENPGTDIAEEAAQDPRPTSIPPAPHDTAPTPSTPPDLPRQQHSTASLRTAPPSSRPETAAARPTTAKPAPQRQSGSPGSTSASSDPADTSPAQTQAPAAPDENEGSGSDSAASQPSTAPTTPGAPTATKPPELCLLVVCLNL